MFTTRTTLIASALAFAAAAVAAPAQAASSDGADVNRTDYCIDGTYYRYCYEGISVDHHVLTPAGVQSDSAAGKSFDTSASWWDGYEYEFEYTTRTHAHALQNDGQVVELHDYRLQQSTQISPEGESCTDLEAFHRTRENIQYLRETASCR